MFGVLAAKRWFVGTRIDMEFATCCSVVR